MRLSIQGAEMADKTAPPSARIDQETSENKTNGEPLDHRRDIFDERFSIVMDGFGQVCEQNHINTAIAIALHPDEELPLVFVRGHEYDIAVLLTRVLRKLKEKLGAELES
jgi:hypothetical protein